MLCCALTVKQPFLALSGGVTVKNGDRFKTHVTYLCIEVMISWDDFTN